MLQTPMVMPMQMQMTISMVMSMAMPMKIPMATSMAISMAIMRKITFLTPGSHIFGFNFGQIRHNEFCPCGITVVGAQRE